MRGRRRSGARKDGGVRSANDTSAPIHLEFDDNLLLPPLFGEHDRHIARIEQLLGVSLSSRGNRVLIAGAPSRAVAARDALMALYGRLKRGHGVDLGDVDAAVRFAEAGERDGADLFGDGDLSIRTRKRVVGPRSANQALYLKTLRDQELVFALGPAGTGKTYLAVAMAVQMLTGGHVDRIILSRPAVEAGERLGFLPGDLREKVDPYLRPLYDALHDMLPGDQVVKRIAAGEIEIAPLAFMRGRTLANAFAILDEAQNTTPVQMKMFLTRLGENSRMVVTGDLSQVDLPQGTRSGLADALETLDGVSGIGVVRFDSRDVVRHRLVTQIVQAYDARDARERGQRRPPKGGT
ncbi:MAG: PhoH family protein [Alphaproteobacteria bacterium]|nr:PhoH family protein [Alphaproteobacteria bacterium]